MENMENLPPSKTEWLAPQGGKRFRRSVSSLLIFMGAAYPATAYTDPGSGALIWQMFGAALLALAVAYGVIRVIRKGRR